MLAPRHAANVGLSRNDHLSASRRDLLTRARLPYLLGPIRNVKPDTRSGGSRAWSAGWLLAAPFLLSLRLLGYPVLGKATLLWRTHR